MNVTFDDEKIFMGYIKYDNSTQLRISFKLIKKDVIIKRLYDRSLRTLKPFSFKTLYMLCPRLAPKTPIMTMTISLINYKDKNSETYFFMIECMNDIVLFLVEYGLIYYDDIGMAEDLVLHQKYDALDDIFKTIPRSFSY